MENASKALVMAAGVLIAIIIIALLYSFINTLSSKAETEDLLLLAEQTTKFNKEYEVFEKQLMRGTDLITVINKAISNNMKYDNQDKVYDVNVKFKLATSVDRIIVTIKNGERLKNQKEEKIFADNTWYELIDNKEKDRINKKLYEFMDIGNTKTDSNGSYRVEAINSTTEIDERNQVRIYDEFTVFKRKYFNS